MKPQFRIAIVLAAIFVILAPIGLVVWQSFLNGPFFARNVHFTLDAFRFVFSDPAFFKALGNSALISAGMTLIAVPIGGLLGLLLVRTDLPGVRWLEPLMLAPMFVSSIVLAFGFVMAFGPVGFISLWAKDIFGFIPWNLYSTTSLIILAGLTHVPHVYIYASTALRSLGSDVEDAARATGAGPLRTALTVSLPMIMPSLLYSAVLVFFLGFELFGLPLILADPQGTQVLATYLYGLTNILGIPSYQLMAVVVIVIIAIALPLVFLQRRLLKNANRYISVKGKATQSRPLRIGVWKWPALALIVLWLLVTVGAPVGALIMRAFVTSWGEGVDLAQVLTLNNFRELAEYPNVVRGIINTLILAIAGGAAAVGVYTLMNLATHRWPTKWSATLDYMVLLPRAMPGIIAGLAIFWVFLFFPPLQPFRQTLLAMWFAYTLVWMAYGMRLISASLLQISPDLEEAGRVAGASAGRVSRELTLPLIKAGLIGSWLLLFVTFVREYSTGVYLLGPGTEVIGSLLVSLWATGGVDLVVTLSVLNIAMVCGGLLLLAAFGKKKNG
ncbi:MULTISPECIES: ABC transporter permease [unclassified Brevundimonas]|uniref:ABC transporter permease n=1 Tax=unclassified Brevundimonas TaxID=2622653 RepID=UPI0025C466D6|nr:MULTISPECIES: iron ABC transporter permease [unclassified Brevundimonas]